MGRAEGLRRRGLKPSVRAVDVGAQVLPAFELIYEEGSPEFRSVWPEIERQLVLARPMLHVGDWTTCYLRLPAGPSAGGIRPEYLEARSPISGEEPLEPGILHDNAAGRLRAMDALGVTAHLLTPGPSVDACLTLPSTLSIGVLGAYNRYLLDYCDADPGRLKASIHVHGAEPAWSATELRELSSHPAVVAATIMLPSKISLDHPNFAPLWDAIAATGVPLLQRRTAAAAVWSAPRLITFLLLTGVARRYPNLRIAFDGGSAAWLLDWIELLRRPSARHVVEAERALALFTDGRAFLAVGACDTPATIAAVRSLVGDGPLLWRSGFPFAGPRAVADTLPRSLTAPARRQIVEHNFHAFADRMPGQFSRRR
jgi:predicted TIM-barrel fold metal-dependent hydrolase